VPGKLFANLHRPVHYFVGEVERYRHFSWQANFAIVLIHTGVIFEMSTIGIQDEPVEPHPLMVLMKLLSLHWKLEAIHVAAQLRLAEALAHGPHTVAELAEVTGTHASSLHRLLRTLTCIGLFTELDGSRFVNTELSQLLRPEVPWVDFLFGDDGSDFDVTPRLGGVASQRADRRTRIRQSLRHADVAILR
jgi:hypothetical protein